MPLPRCLPARLHLQLDREERLAAEPPKLSKHKFQPMPLQVLTSDELAGSLRRLKPTTMLAKDRFKSLQKRALIEPRRKIEQKKQGKKVEYIQVGARPAPWCAYTCFLPRLHASQFTRPALLPFVCCASSSPPTLVGSCPLGFMHQRSAAAEHAVCCGRAAGRAGGAGGGAAGGAG